MTSLLGLVFLGLGAVGIGFVPATMFWLAVGLMFLVGFMNPMINGPLMAIIQAIVAPQMQGRVFTLITSFATAMTPIGLIVAGPVADRLGVQSWYIFGGVVTILLGVGAFLIPAIMHVEDRPAHVASVAGELKDPLQIVAPGLVETTGD